MDLATTRPSRWWALPAVAAFAIGMLLTLALWHHGEQEYRQQLRAEFVSRALTIESAVQQRIGVYSQALHSAAALFDVNGNVDRDAWRRFVAGMRLQQNYPGLMALAWAPYVDADGARAAVAAARADGIAEYGIWPPGRRERHVMTLYIEPFTPENRGALGQDMYLDPERRRVMDLARDTATPKITARIDYRSDGDHGTRPAFVMYLPVYRGGTPATVEERRARLLGFVLCPFRMPDLMPMLVSELVGDIGFAVYDGDRVDESRLYYRNVRYGQVRMPLLSKLHTMEMGGRQWTLVFTSAREFEDSAARYRPIAILGIGTAVTLSLSAILFSMAAARRRAVGLAHEMTRSLRASEAKWHALFSQAPLGVMVLDRDGRVIDCNQAVADLIGAPRERIIGFNVLHEARDPALRPWLERALAGERVTFESGYRATLGDGHGHFRFNFQPIEQEGSFSVLQCFVEDITEQHRARERIAMLAERDALTGLANRLLLNDRLQQMLLVAERERSRLAVMFLDLDHFKTINDSLGHSVGDTVLKTVAQRIAASVRESDTVARLGGDEFVVVLRDIESVDTVANLAAKMMENITAPLALPDRILDITGSIGIAIFPDDGRDTETLIRNADTAMYYAKETGRNNFQFFTADMNARAVEAMAMEAALRRALREREFRLYYQPQFQAATGELVGVEALIRWQRPGSGLVLPEHFIPEAGQRDLLGAIGEWVLREACCAARGWQRPGMPPLPVTINIAAAQLRSRTLAATVARVLEDSGLPAACLELEITEGALAHNADASIALLCQIKEMGVRIAIDDFGTGYSSLSYLKRFPVDKLKIDRSFVRDLTIDVDDAAITQAIIAIARKLGLQVIAEGVETEGQLQFLRQHHCDEVQGYYLSPPLDTAEMARFIVDHDLLRCRTAS